MGTALALIFKKNRHNLQYNFFSPSASQPQVHRDSRKGVAKICLRTK